MTKLALIVSGTLFSGALVALTANAADKAPAAAPATAKPADKAAAAPAAEKGAAPAAAAAPSGPPAPSPEVETLYKGYEGSWKCDTTFNANSMGPGSPEMKTKSEVKIKKEPGGFWYKGEYKAKKTKTNPEIAATFMLGYDAGLKQAVSVSTDNMGGYSIEHDASGSAEKVSFVGDGSMMGQKVKVRETMTHKDPKTVEHTFEVDMGKGFQPMGVDVCKK
jgi:hypothetical protein